MYTTQTGRIQIFDQLSAHFIKTASSSTTKSFVKYCLVYSSLQCKKISYLIAARMTKNVGAFSLSCIVGSRLFVTQYKVLDILGGWMRKCLITEEAGAHVQGYILQKYELASSFNFFNTIDPSIKPKNRRERCFFFHADDPK